MTLSFSQPEVHRQVEQPIEAAMAGLTARRALIVLFVLLFPFYVFPSGGLQISFVPIAIACALGWRHIVGMFHTPDRRVLLPLLVFVAYVFIVNLWYSVLYWDRPFTSLPIVRSVPYVFNYGLFSLVLLHLRQGGSREMSLFMTSVLCSLLVQSVLCTASSPETIGRISGFFNNPNQLGYFALCSLVMGAAFALRRTVRPLWVVLYSMPCLYLVTISLSNAAIGAAVLLCVLTGVMAFRSRRSLVPAFALAAVGFGVLVAASPVVDLIGMLRWRAETLGPLIQTAPSDRRLTRFVEHPGYMVLGAGERLTNRFEATGEVHSTLGTVLFSYGVPGSVAFAMFLVNIVRGDALKSTLLVTPLLAYGFLHNGLRFPWFWLCLCLIYYCASTSPSTDERP